MVARNIPSQVRVSPASFARTSAPVVHRTRAARMCAPAPSSSNDKAASSGEEEISPAEATRRALSADKPLVQFRKDEVTLTREDNSFSYTPGNTGGGGIDVWLVSTVLIFVTPVILFAVGVATGYIDVSPR